MKTPLLLFGMNIFFFLSTACARPNYTTPGRLLTNPSQSLESDKANGYSNCPVPLKKLGFCMSYKWLKLPASTKEEGKMLIKFFRTNRADKSPVPIDLSQDLLVYLWMPSMGHGSAPVRFVQRDTGTYELHNIFFIMAGDWDLHIRLQNNNQIEDEAIVSLVF